MRASLERMRAVKHMSVKISRRIDTRPVGGRLSVDLKVDRRNLMCSHSPVDLDGSPCGMNTGDLTSTGGAQLTGKRIMCRSHRAIATIPGG